MKLGKKKSRNTTEFKKTKNKCTLFKDMIFPTQSLLKFLTPLTLAAQIRASLYLKVCLNEKKRKNFSNEPNSYFE